MVNQTVQDRDPGVDAVFHALANPTRRSVIEALLGGPARISDLAEPHAMSLTAVSKHIGVLADSGLVAIERKGRERWCRLQADSLDEAASVLDRYRRFWDRALDRLDDVVTDGKEP